MLFYNTILSFGDFCTMTKIPYSVLEKQMSSITLSSMGMLDQEALSGLLANTLRVMVDRAMSDSHMARNQALTLLHSQGGIYRPFVSSTVNSAIELSMKGTNTLLKVTEAIASRVAQSPLMRPPELTGEEYITIEGAVEVINQQISAKALTDGSPTLLSEMYKNNDISSMPEVNGRRVSPPPIEFEQVTQITDLNDITEFLEVEAD